jgi:hypothetical protein
MYLDPNFEAIPSVREQYYNAVGANTLILKRVDADDTLSINTNCSCTKA